MLLFSASRQKDTITRVCFFKRIFLEGSKNDFKGFLKCFKVFSSVLSVGFYQSLSLQFFGFSVVVCFFIFHTSFFVVGNSWSTWLGYKSVLWVFILGEKKRIKKKRGKFSPGRARFCLDHLTRGDGNNKKIRIFFQFTESFSFMFFLLSA